MHKDHPDSLPLIVTDEERLARAIFHPFHLTDAGKLKPAAFKAPSGRRDVSVNRLVAMDPDNCKARARAIANPGTFWGFAVIAALTVRQSGSDVVDSRELYLGHADITHAMVLQKNEPPPPEFNARLKQMATGARYFADPAPETDLWSGEDFSATK